MKKFYFGILLSSFVFLHNPARAQSLTLPEVSQRSEVTQTIGLSEITISYHSPAVNGRTVYGGIVPYDAVWRCGANENTTINFSHAAKVEGKTIPAGKYGLHMIPSATEWTIIFSKNHTSWGSFFYKPEEDALRVNVKPVMLPESVEYLNYGFLNRQAESTVAYLEWEKLRVPFTISFDVKEIVLQNIRNELRSLPAFGQTAHLEAAQYCLQHNFNQDEALKWVDQAIKVNPGFGPKSTKALLLEQKGDVAGSKKLIDESLPLANEVEVNAFGYQLLAMKKVKQAIEVFQLNVKNYPDSWNTYDSLAEAYGIAGEKSQAKAFYQLALKHNPPANQIPRLEQLIK
jgi:hypothetical protein